MFVCERCKKEHDGTILAYSKQPGRFCSRKCANARDWSPADRKKKSKSALSSKKVKAANEKSTKVLFEHRFNRRTITPVSKTCPICSLEFITKRIRKIHCTLKCAYEANKRRNNTPEAKQRLRDIGRVGGFGKKGMTSGGTRYQSLLEKRCFEYLEERQIEFEPHKPIPNSSKISDCYIPHLDLWIEIDGIDRDKRQKWLKDEYKYWINKLEIYKSSGLKLKIVKKIEDIACLV